MNRKWNGWIVAVFGLLLLLSGFAALPTQGQAQGVLLTPTAPSDQLPAVHPLYGDCDDGNGTIPGGTVPSPTPAFEPFQPNSIYVDWCGEAILTIAPPGETIPNPPASAAQFDPTVGHRIGLFYSTDTADTGWWIANYSYRVDYSAQELAERKSALLRELCPLGNICNQILIAQVGKLGAQYSLLDASGERPLNQGETKVFVPFVSSQE
jgi:hypothetical protein